MKSVLFFLLLSFSLVADKPIPVVVIGSGPAGLSSALVTGRERFETHVFLGEKAGGPLNAKTCLSNWPGSVLGKGDAVIERLFAQLKKYPTITLHEASITRVDFSKWPYRLQTSTGKVIEAKAVIMASGGRPKKLGVPGEEVHPIHHYVYKADREKFAQQTVAVVGGGIDAAKKTRLLSKSAKKVYLIVRHSHMQLPYMEKQAKNVEILFNTQVEAIKKGELHLTGGRVLSVDSLVLAIGIEPHTSLVKGQLDLDEKGYIKLLGRTQATSKRGVFAAGNVVDAQYRQGAIAAGDGMKAGYDAAAFLRSLE